MNRRHSLIALFVPLPLAAGCGSAPDLAAIAGLGGRGGTAGAPNMGELMRTRMPDLDEMSTQSRLMQAMMDSPDLPAWHEQREKMALAVGDRTFERGFDRVFDAMTVALASLGSRVNNMERVSGYLTASIPDLGPAKTSALQREGLRQYAVAKGYPPTIVERKGDGFGLDVGATSGMMSRGMAGLTLSLVRQGAKQTKVKLRFDNVYYPALVNEYYKTVWAAVDKQMFLDQALD
jgi:hypothetical protein